jgi:hypothetical protein
MPYDTFPVYFVDDKNLGILHSEVVVTNLYTLSYHRLIITGTDIFYKNLGKFIPVTIYANLSL